ncbi:MAG TPA: hypothetical protein VFQ92_09515 [Blastocatellia bacterium]|nr:hypothetical protein [Blastocatellia bacterium]
MRKRLVFAAFCILALPLLFAPSQTEQTTTSAPFATVALAGRNSLGGWCECGTAGCICDPGEEPGNGLTISPENDEPVDQNADQGVDPASGLMVMTLALLFWLRLRL